jgi:hypothetical protein
MTGNTLHGVIAAIATAIDERGEPDCPRSIALARFLLDHGCDGLNVLGTTGEGTSSSLLQRQRLMQAYADSGLPLNRMLVGTGAAALDDAIALTCHAAALGFAGALVPPPFYYKGVSDDGLFAVIAAIMHATAAQPIPIYLYHFAAQSGLPWRIGPDPPPHRYLRRARGRIERLFRRHGFRARGGEPVAAFPGLSFHRSSAAAGPLRPVRRMHFGNSQPQRRSLRPLLSPRRR